MSNPGFLDSLSPWTSRSATPTPKPGQMKGDNEKSIHGEIGKQQQQQGGDHRVNHRHRLSLSVYPDDCPSLVVRWFYAVDVRERPPIVAAVLIGLLRHQSENHSPF